jgi:hypothetical protein
VAQAELRARLGLESSQDDEDALPRTGKPAATVG